MSIPADLPECQFSGERYLALSADGSFVALVTRSALQVWQVGGGLLYEAPYSRRFSNDPGVCGMDMPRLAISPDGRLLAVSGMEYMHNALTRFFRVVDIFKNESVYEWDGSPSSMHGSLDAAPALGFSHDGLILQTFDPLRFALLEGSHGSAFRFWSTVNWEEIDPASPRLSASYTIGELLFAWHTPEGLEVRLKTSGALMVSLPQAPCSLLYPCQMRFSPDGGQALLVSTLAGTCPYRGTLLADRLLRVNMRSGEVLEGPAGLFRDLEGVQVDDDGRITLAFLLDAEGIPAGAWWAAADGFDGLRPSLDGALFFTPQVFYLAGKNEADPAQPCSYCAACRLDEPWSLPDCRPGLISDRGNWIAIVQAGDNLTLLDVAGDNLGELPLPPELAASLPKSYPGGADSRGLTLRLLGYAEKYHTAFYCLELDQRAAGCVMADLDGVSLMGDIQAFSYLRFSPDGERAALFDSRAYQLVVVDLASRRLTRRSAFQARAYPALPYFFRDGETLAFLIQELDDHTAFWLEMVAADGSRALGRVPLQKAALLDPVALGADPAEHLWAVGERDGRAILLDFESGTPLHEWQAHTNGLIGLEFAAGGRLLVSMGTDGLLRLWGVPS